MSNIVMSSEYWGVILKAQNKEGERILRELRENIMVNDMEIYETGVIKIKDDGKTLELSR